ncbi:MAG TPA: hypothetical protein VEA80_19420 [Vitreimonas sp.]|uniref:hypothetical protein n=1 Tax=Vitreimonas sp. TaxID=3069702 RepID=UPI002D6B2D55|nr:hypothetical protein [Vitreimonas sp.]HYD89660.1 hypothetical protein [Vitreimonas sp.]
MAEPEPFDAEKVANLTLLQLRRVDERLTTLMEIVVRQDERLARVERDMGEIRRDIGEIRSEMVLMENRMLNQSQRVLNEVIRMQDHGVENHPAR